MKGFIVVLVILLLPLSCKSGNDIFASVNDGNITRAEFNDWLASRGIPAESVYKDKYAMSDYLRLVAVEKLTAIKAEQSEFDKNKSYRTIENTLYKNLLSTFFTDKLREEITFSEKAMDLSIIRLFFKKENGKERLAEEENKKIIISNLLTQLKAGKDFNDLAAKYSEDSASQKKGHLGIIPENIMEDGIKSAVNQLKENEYTEAPIIVGKSLCLIKLHKRYDLTQKNIKNVVTDKENAEKIIDFYKNKELDNLVNRLLAGQSVVSNIDKVSYLNSEEVIFSIGDEIFTSGELDDILKLFYSLKHGIPSVENFLLKEKKITSEKIFKERLLASEAEKRHLQDDAEFKRKWFYLKRATLAGAFKYDTLSKKVSVTNKDALNEYIQNKNNKYYKMKKLNNKETKVYLSYKEVAPVIKNNLSRENLKSLKKKWDNDILNEGKYVVKDKNLLIN